MKVSCVFKLGGSLLEPPDLVDLPQRILRTIGTCGEDRPLMVVGGGPTVDLIRRWDKVYKLDETFCHWLSVRALSINSTIIEKILPGAILIQTESECEDAWQSGFFPIFDSYSFLNGVDERKSDPLPREWRVTSDSIAARVANHFKAPRLVLLKSTTMERDLTVNDASKRGLVDAYFEEAARGIPEILMFNLRDEHAKPVSLVL